MDKMIKFVYFTKLCIATLLIVAKYCKRLKCLCIGEWLNLPGYILHDGVLCGSKK